MKEEVKRKKFGQTDLFPQVYIARCIFIVRSSSKTWNDSMREEKLSIRQACEIPLEAKIVRLVVEKFQQYASSILLMCDLGYLHALNHSKHVEHL